MLDKESKAVIRKLEAQVGNLEVQNADYQQIVKELSSGRLEILQTKNNSILLPTELDVLIIYDVYVQSTAMLLHYSFCV